MGSRIRKAIGYGMPIGQFKFHVTERMEDMDDLYNYIEDRVATVHELAQTPRQDVLENLMEQGYGRNLNITYNPNNPDRWNSPSDMYDIVWEGDAWKYIMFQPMLDERTWKRFDNDLDFVEDSINHNHDMQTIIVQREYGFYPWGNHIRDTKTNEPVEWDGMLHMSDENGKRPDIIVPDVPPCMRYWLLATGMLEKDGIDALRPVYAKWWT